MILKVRGKQYMVELNGTDYVTKEEPNKADFKGLFDVMIDSEIRTGMRLSGIFESGDGWHICLYEDGDNILYNFGELEDGDRAEEGHVVGDCIVRGNRLYSVTADISEGNMIVVGGNVKPTTIQAEMRKLMNGEWPQRGQHTKSKEEKGKWVKESIT